MSELKTVGKMSQLMFWNKNNNSNSNNHNDNGSSSQSNNSMKETDSKDSKRDATKDDTKHGNKRNWLHTPQALIKGHVVYLVKFFGNLPVDQPKGIDVVKDTIRKLQFAQQMRKAETGAQEKFRKVEITISVDGVAIQEPRTQKILYQFPLHNISYCADEKGVKKFFSFIAKTIKTNEAATSAATSAATAAAVAAPATTNGYNSSSSSNSSNSNNNTINVTTSHESHECFVFISNKLASDITLTIGQAFELAFRKYINNTEKTELGKAQQQITQLEKMTNIYKNRLLDLSQKLTKTDLDTLLFKYGIKDILEVPDTYNDDRNGVTPGQLTNGITPMDDNNKLLIDTNVSMGMTTSKSQLTTTTTTTTTTTIATATTISTGLGMRAGAGTGTGTGATNAATVPATSSLSSSFLPVIPPRNNLAAQILPKTGSISQKMEELLLNSDSDSDFDPRAEETNINGNNSTYNSNGGSGGGYGGSGGGYGGSGINMSGNNFKTTDGNDLFGFEPPKSFGQQLFHYNNDSKLQNNNNNNINSNYNNNNHNNNNNNNINYNNNNNNNSNNNSLNSNNFSELNTTPPLLAPPPKATAPRRTTTNLITQNTNALAAPNGVTISADLFGSDPFEMGNSGSGSGSGSGNMGIGMAMINAPSIFQKQQQQQQFNKISVDDFTLESLDPLRK